MNLVEAVKKFEEELSPLVMENTSLLKKRAELVEKLSGIDSELSNFHSKVEEVAHKYSEFAFSNREDVFSIINTISQNLSRKTKRKSKKEKVEVLISILTQYQPTTFAELNNHYKHLAGTTLLSAQTLIDAGLATSDVFGKVDPKKLRMGRPMNAQKMVKHLEKVSV
jgi:hypothetical protein